MDMLLVNAVLVSIATGAGLGLTAYFSKAQKGESFEVKKLAKTVFIGASVGLILHFNGQAITSENWGAYCAANGGVIMLLDKVWSLCRNYIARKV